MVKQKLRFWKIPVTKHFDNVVQKAVDMSTHVTKSEFVRDAVREKLAAIGLKVELQTIEED